MCRPIFCAAMLALTTACGGDATDTRKTESSLPAAIASGPTVQLAPAPAASVITVRLTNPIASGADKVGDSVTVVVQSDVKDAAGKVTIPAGALIRLLITALEGASDSRPGGRLMMEPATVLAEGQQVPLRGKVGRVPALLNGTVLIIERSTEFTITVEPTAPVQKQ